MANVRALVGRVIEANQSIVAAMTLIREMSAQVKADPTALDEQADWEGSYPDLTKEEIMDAIGAWDQLLFSYDSGDPTQKSKIYKLL